MRIAALIVGLVIGFAVTFQACTAYGPSGIGRGLGSEVATELVPALEAVVAM